MLSLLASILILTGGSETDSVLKELGLRAKTLSVGGTFSTTGTQNLNGLPFTAVMDSNDAFRLTMGGPFGITAARMWAERDTFVFVNYLMQEAHEGKPDAKSLQRVLPFPLSASYLMSLMRGRPPGDPSRFIRSDPRTDEYVLFMYRDTAVVEYLLVDTLRSLIKQYQRKELDGTLQLDVVFKNIKDIDGIMLPHTIELSVEDRKQTATFRIDRVTINGPIEERLVVDIPPSFVRTTYR